MLFFGGHDIVFTRGRPHELWAAHRDTVPGTFAPPRLLTELNTANDEYDAWISEDGHHVVFARNYGNGDADVFEASRRGEGARADRESGTQKRGSSRIVLVGRPAATVWR
jgi:hypothetical protein